MSAAPSFGLLVSGKRAVSGGVEEAAASAIEQRADACRSSGGAVASDAVGLAADVARCRQVGAYLAALKEVKAAGHDKNIGF